MGLKDKNPINEIVLVRILNVVKEFFWEIVKIAFRNESYKLFFQKDVQTTQKTRLFITFTSVIQMEWIKASLVDKKYNLLGKILKNLSSSICGFIFLLAELKFGLFVV